MPLAVPPAGPRPRSVGLGLALAAPQAFAQTDYLWSGSATSSAWDTPGNWQGNTAPPNATGTYDARIDIDAGGTNQPIYTAAQGNQDYANTNGRGLVIGSGSNGSLTITGGSFSTSGSGTADVLGNTTGTGTLVINGGSYTSGTPGLEFGVHEGGSGVLTLTAARPPSPTWISRRSRPR
ncbi:MAG: hypothetical protein WDO13_13710 [Verrucomicrobiota bacterium]